MSANSKSVHAFSLFDHLQISKALKVGQETHAGLLLDALQLQPAEILGAVEHVLGSAAGEKQVDEGLASMTMNWVDQAFVGVSPLVNNSMGTLCKIPRRSYVSPTTLVKTTL